MESSGPSGNPPHHPKLGWSGVLGTIIALLTLTLPLLITTHYSGEVELERDAKNIQNLPKND